MRQDGKNAISMSVSRNKKTNPFHFRKSWSVYLVLHQRGQNERDHGWRFTKMAVADIGLGRMECGASWADPPFLFCAVRRGLTPPWSIPALYTPTACLVAIRSGAHTAGLYQNKTQRHQQHTHKQPAKQRHKRTIYIQIYRHNSGYPQEKSDNVRLAKILHFRPCTKNPNNI